MQNIKFRLLVCCSAYGLLLTAYCSLSGCNIIGVAAQILPVADVAPAYTGMKGQTVGVMVWADRGSRIDFPALQADVARGVTSKLSMVTNPKNGKEKEKVPPELAGVQYLNPLSVIRFQEDHPELESLPSTEIATRLGVTRVIYIEVFSFETRSNDSIDLFKGSVGAKLEVLEVTAGPNGKTARIAYSDPDVRTTWPPKQTEGIAGSDEVTPDKVYMKTVDQLTTEIAARFVTHPPQ